MIDFKKDIIDYYDTLSKTFSLLNIEEINRTLNFLVDAHKKEKTIYVFGNGGSSATASHMVCDFNKGISAPLTKKMNLICLSDNIPMMTAIANDISYDDIFLFPLIGKIKSGDVIIAISGSGNSKNIIKAVEYGKDNGAIIIGMTGYNGGALLPLSDYKLHAPINDMMKSEDVHMTFDHMIMTILSSFLKANQNT